MAWLQLTDGEGGGDRRAGENGCETYCPWSKFGVIVESERPVVGRPSRAETNETLPKSFYGEITPIMMTRVQGVSAALVVVLATAGVPAIAQQGAALDSREAVGAEFLKRSRQLDREHVQALAAVAAKESDEAANATYRLLFNLAIAKNVFDAAEPAAEKVIQGKSLDFDVEMLAQLINAIAEVDRGEYKESLTHLEEFLQMNQENLDAKRGQLDPNTVLGVGEAYFQRLVQAGQYDVARRLCEDVLANAKNPTVLEHFQKRLGRVSMLGTKAPAIAGKDVDGKAVSLADYEGKVVLVDFWATWCPPCSMQMLKLNGLREYMKGKDFEILGVNVDALREGSGGEATQALVRRYLVDHQAGFPSVVLAPGEQGVPESYGVDEIPANFLIGRDGKIIQFELGEGNTIKAIEAALGEKGR